MGFFDNLFGGGHHSNPANKAMPYLNQIPGQTQQYMQPYMQAGQSTLPYLQQQYGQLMQDPSARLNQIGAGYQQSPGLNFAIQKALEASGRGAAASGMAGSPQHQEQNIDLATGYANRDYENFMNHALGLYGGGLSGGQNLVSGGQRAGQSMADMIAQTLAQQGNLAFQGQAQQNQNRNDMFGSLFQGAGALGAFKPFQQGFSSLGNYMFGG